MGDPELVAQLNEVLRTELMAVGVRMALSPDADLITDPRWGRNQECYSEDTDVVQALIVAAVQALQSGSTLTEDSPSSPRSSTSRALGHKPTVWTALLDHSGGFHRPASGGL